MNKHTLDNLRKLNLANQGLNEQESALLIIAVETLSEELVKLSADRDDLRAIVQAVNLYLADECHGNWVKLMQALNVHMSRIIPGAANVRAVLERK